MLKGPQSQHSDDKDPIEEASKVQKQVIASEMINSSLAEAKAKTAKAQAEAKEAEARLRKAEAGGDSGGFKLKGEVNMGTIDFQAQQAKAETELERLRTEQRETVATLGLENEQLRDKIHEKEVESLRLTMEAQISNQNKIIENIASRGSFADQLTAVREMAGQLGYSISKGEATDLAVQMQLKEMEFKQNLELRRLAKEEKAEQRRWDLELRRLDDERKSREKEDQRKDKRDELIASAPKVLGEAIGSALLSGVGAQEGAITNRPATTNYNFEAGEGEFGEAPCPSCKTPVAIGATATAAVCANCGSRMSIKRLSAQSQKETPPKEAEVGEE